MKKSLFIILIFAFSSAFAGFWDEKKDGLQTGKISKGGRNQYELAVCSIDAKVKKNSAYYHLPSVNTQLLCDIGPNTRIGTFEAFYNDKWRLIQIVNIDSRLSTKDKTVPYSLIYLERQK